MQNDAKIHLKSPQNEHEKTCAPLLQWQKRHPNAWRAGTRQNAVFFAVPGVALLPKSVAKPCKITEKRSEIRSQKWTPRFRYRKIDTSSTEAAKWTFGALRVTSRSRFGRETNNDRGFSSAKIVHPQSGPPFAIVRCLRSCPPRGGPIRSVSKVNSE